MTRLDHAVLQTEYNIIIQTLVEVNFNKKKAAEVLGIDRKTIYNKIKKAQQTPTITSPVQVLIKNYSL